MASVPRQKPQCGCCGCIGSIVATVVGAAIVYVLITPWTFHMGGRWTPLQRWDGVGELRDSAGARYGLYVRLSPQVNIDYRNDSMDCCTLYGKAQVCTAGGAKYNFDLSGGFSGAWLRSDGSKVNINLMESGHPRLPRQFYLTGVWRGANLALDDRSSMSLRLLPDGNLTPRANTTTADPAKHVRVTIGWGTLSDFDSLCASLGNANH